ncbi:MAG TPA: hypothetical protein VG755_41930 [Nannocystaceae bacterium]|nr:hypothetical protein [Nannocystaceae bacterium]
MNDALPELDDLDRLIARLGSAARVERLADIVHRDRVYPIDAVVLGSRDPSAPTFVLAYLTTLCSLLFDVLQRASAAPSAWSGFDATTRTEMTHAAFARWYGR